MAVTHPFPDSLSLEALYSTQNYRDMGERFVGPMEGLIRRFRTARFKRIEKLSQKGSILDIGCGRGLMLSMARERGWRTAGVELNDDTARYARETLGLDIRTGDLKDAGFADGSFDVVSLWHSLEHLKDPAETLSECRRILRPGGLLTVSVPNIGSLQSVMSGRHWFHLDVPYHLYHFSTGALLGLLEKNSFGVFRATHFSFEFNPFGFLQSISNMAGIRRNLLYDALKRKDIGKRGGFADYLGMSLLFPAAAPVSLILALFEALIKRGGCIEVYARKEG